MPRSLASTTIVLREEELKLVLRERSGYWQIHCKPASAKRWVRKSSGTVDFDEAKIKAEDLAAEIRILERRGIPIVSKKFRAVAQTVSAKFKEEVKNGTGKKTYAEYHRAIDSYLIPFFGNFNIDNITPQIMNDFHVWRREKVGRELKQSTQHTHNLALTKVFDNAIERGYMTEYLRPSNKNTGTTGEARGTFTHEELIQLQTFLKNWATQSSNETTRDLRELLVLYVAFLASTGARAGTELKELKWKHIQFVEKDGKTVISIHLTQGKIGARNLIARKEVELVLEKIKQIHNEFDSLTLEELLTQKNENYVFRMKNGNRPYNFVKAFGAGIREANMLTNGRDKYERSLYSLRHYYATQRLYEGLTYEQLSENMGTSAKMLKEHYQHFDLMEMADKLSGNLDSADNSSELIGIKQATNSNLMNFLGVSTGIYLSLDLQNKTAKQELEQEIQKQSKQ